MLIIRRTPATSLQFSKKLEAYGVQHFAEEYIGGHINKIGGIDRRIYTELLPFFDTYLQFVIADLKDEKNIQKLRRDYDCRALCKKAK